MSWHSVINEMQELDGHPSAEKGWDLFTRGLKEEASSSTPTIGGRIQDIEMPRKLQQFLDNSTQVSTYQKKILTCMCSSINISPC